MISALIIRTLIKILFGVALFSRSGFTAELRRQAEARGDVLLFTAGDLLGDLAGGG